MKVALTLLRAFLLAVITALMLWSCDHSKPLGSMAKPTEYTDVSENFPTEIPAITNVEVVEEIKIGKEKGQVIIDAIEQYNLRKGYYYPEELQQLVPDLLIDIPTTNYGQEYQYKGYDSEKFELWFTIKTYRMQVVRIQAALGSGNVVGLRSHNSW